MILLVLASFAPLACEKTYQLGPLTAPVPTPTATPDIQWPNAEVSWLNDGGFGPFSPPYQSAQLDLQVNGLPDSTAGVTLSGSGAGGSLPLTYSGPSTVSGLNCSHFQTGITYTPGATYILKSTTSAGSVSATIVAPGGISLAPDYSFITWGYLGNFLSLAAVFEVYSYPPYCNGGYLFLDTPNAVPPVNITSGYNYACFYNYLLKATVRSSTLVTGVSAPATFFASQYWCGTNP